MTIGFAEILHPTLSIETINKYLKAKKPAEKHLKTLKKENILPANNNENHVVKSEKPEEHEEPAILDYVEPENLDEPIADQTAVELNDGFVEHESIIDRYLQKQRAAKSGYSLRYDEKSEKFSIGNCELVLDTDNDQITILKPFSSEKLKEIIASDGLMELFTRSSPNMAIVTQNDLNEYRDLLIVSNAIYREFQPNKPFRSDKSEKWKLIKTLLKLNQAKLAPKKKTNKVEELNDSIDKWKNNEISNEQIRRNLENMKKELSPEDYEFLKKNLIRKC